VQATAIVPVKRFAKAKQRLAKALSPAARAALCR
jgi:2-phospho-L-lactate guanylyltransferase (CobY/MobA/RfbA family)